MSESLPLEGCPTIRPHLVELDDIDVESAKQALARVEDAKRRVKEQMKGMRKVLKEASRVHGPNIEDEDNLSSDEEWPHID